MRFTTVKAIVVLILASIPIAALPVTPAAASASYTWSISCKGDGSASAYFAWYDNGVLVGSGGSGCSGASTLSGAGTIPAGANSVYAELDSFVAFGLGQNTTTQSFDPSNPSVSINLHSSASVSGCSKCWYTGPKLSESANFTLRS